MKLATFRQPDSDAAYPGDTFAAVVTSVHPDDPEVAVRAVALPGCRDVGEHLTSTPQEQKERVELALRAAKEDHSLLLDTTQLVYDTLIPFPTKVICVGLNYTDHIAETGQERPEHPTLFAKFAQSLTGALDPIEVPEEDHRVDYEGELCIVIGEPGRRIAVEDAREHIAGFAVADDVSMRGFQGRTSEWLQGKVWEASTPVGPWLVTPDELSKDARILTHVNGEVRQESRVADVVFSPEQLVAYASQLITLNPGDLILTGTPAGVALARKDEEGRRPWLRAGDVVEVEITGLGRQRNELC
ncbi:fumarylacetoacetate hydrolase family protein [Micrococcus sp. EYE_162]|uniref:fumarylacetoacetate hydrolase family protein n=1 Tax=unclassified Micrococcus TaxID=2620948 RepID=UPI002005AD91|nr:MULTISPECIES: fumarylacetoacetate hydrolase family protein [unclassified Micrococcus]MCK6094612.1 fumarylacetoacetate hydrolase family protein [Micrococcus sp. EYE_212]MCK6171336.1 fumarylacetoacetate hydrolase family protein [Micrococcus sp. EYE_162]